MFAIKFIECLSAGKPLDIINCKDMEFYRTKFAVEAFKNNFIC